MTNKKNLLKEHHFLQNHINQKDDINWNTDNDIYSHLLERLYKFLPDSLYDIDVALTFNKNGV